MTQRSSAQLPPKRVDSIGDRCQNSYCQVRCELPDHECQPACDQLELRHFIDVIPALNVSGSNEWLNG